MASPEKLSDDMMENVSGGMISEDDALAQALAYVGMRRDQVDYVKHVELDHEHGRMVYEVSFFQGGFEYEFDVDAENGNILKYEKDYD